MSKDILTSGPSRRSIAKGAAWAVPAVSVAAAAPALAASPLPTCSGTQISLGVEDCRDIGLFSPEASFTITNPAGSGCTIPVGTPVSLTGGALASIGLAALIDLNVGILSFGSDISIATLATPLLPGQSVSVKVFPAGLNISVLGTYRLSVLNASARFTLTLGAGRLLSLCTSPND